MKFVVIQKTREEVDYRGDIYADIFALFPRNYPAVIKYVEYTDMEAAKEALPEGTRIMPFKTFVNFKAALDYDNSNLNLALKLRGKQKEMELRLEQEQL